MKSMIGKKVIVRTCNAGVHVGKLIDVEGKCVTLRDAVRIWRWRGANTLNEIALRGVNRNEYTRISEAVPYIGLTEAIEIIPVADGVDLGAVWN